MNVPLPRTTSSTSAGSSGEPAPIQADPTGTFYRFEKTVSKTRGGDGSAGVWKRACNGREDKGKHRDLHQAYAQLLNYAGDLENPPPLNIPVARTSRSAVSAFLPTSCVWLSCGGQDGGLQSKLDFWGFLVSGSEDGEAVFIA